jgi:hypothetical protein
MEEQDNANYFIFVEGTGSRVNPWTVSKWRENQGSGIDFFNTKKHAVDFAKGLIKLYRNCGRIYKLKIRYFNRNKKQWIEKYYQIKKEN